MKYCEKCLAKNKNFDFFVRTLQTFCGAFHQRERVMLQKCLVALKGLSWSWNSAFSQYVSYHKKLKLGL